MTKNQFILENAEKLCNQENISLSDLATLIIMKELNLLDYHSLETFKQSLEEEHDTIWDLQPTLEEDLEHALAVQHARDIINILRGEELWIKI